MSEESGVFESLPDVIDELQALRDAGYVATHRAGDTGVGKTLEDMLGIEENNDMAADISIPPDRHIELKSVRADASGYTTLFTQEPPRDSRPLWGRQLLNTVGYPQGERTSLYTTLQFNEPNPQGLFVEMENERVRVCHTDHGTCARYPKSMLQRRFDEKFQEVILVTAQSRGEGAREYFWYDDALHLTGFDEEVFFSLLEDQQVVVDTRMHVKPGETPRNHGTGWRVPDSTLPELFEHSTSLLDDEEYEEVPATRQRGQQFISDYMY